MPAGNAFDRILPSKPVTRVLAVIIAAILVLAIIGTVSLLALREEKSQGHTDLITLAATATDGPAMTTEGELITHLAITGGHPGDVGLSVSLTDMIGRPLPINVDYGVSVALTNINSGTAVDAQKLTPVETDVLTPTFKLEDPGIDSEGWWHIETSITRPNGVPLASEFYVLFPDPNMAGFDAPVSLESDPEAEAMLSQALVQMSEWKSLRWWEWLSGGNDSLILADFAVTTTAANGQPDAFRNDMRFAGGFERRDNGAPPAPPARDHYTAVSIGDRGWNRNAEGEIKETSAVRYLPINRYPETYEGAVSVRFGIQDEVDGHQAQIVTFSVPTLPSQSEAWFAFWIDAETGDVLKLAMVANNHYMIWIYTDINDPFVIEPPEGVATSSATPFASPFATP